MSTCEYKYRRFESSNPKHPSHHRWPPVQVTTSLPVSACFKLLLNTRAVWHYRKGKTPQDQNTFVNISTHIWLRYLKHTVSNNWETNKDVNFYHLQSNFPGEKHCVWVSHRQQFWSYTMRIWYPHQWCPSNANPYNQAKRYDTSLQFAIRCNPINLEEYKNQKPSYDS
jgi:hypothetical protein